jgi:hypothetical protein
LVDAKAYIASPVQSDAAAARSAWLSGISRIPLLLSHFAEKAFGVATLPTSDAAVLTGKREVKGAPESGKIAACSVGCFSLKITHFSAA